MAPPKVNILWKGGKKAANFGMVVVKAGGKFLLRKGEQLTPEILFERTPNASFETRIEEYVDKIQNVNKEFRLTGADELKKRMEVEKKPGCQRAVLRVAALEKIKNEDGLTLKEFLEKKGTGDNYKEAIKSVLTPSGDERVSGEVEEDSDAVEADSDAVEKDLAGAQAGLNASLKEFVKNIDKINGGIGEGEYKRYDALSSFVRGQRSEVNTAIEKFQDKELDNFKTTLINKSTNTNYRQAVAAFYGVQGEDKIKDAVNELHQQLEKAFESVQSSNKKAIDEHMANDEKVLANNLDHERQRIAFFALFEGEKGLDTEQLFQFQGLAEAQQAGVALTTTTGKVDLDYDPNSKTLQLDFKNVTNLMGNLNTDAAYRELDQIMQAARMEGIGPPIQIDIKGGKPKAVEELARRSYEAALKNGYKPDEIQINIPPGFRPEGLKESDKKEKIPQYIFRKPGFKQRVEEEAKNMRQSVVTNPEQLRSYRNELANMKAKAFGTDQENELDMHETYNHGAATPGA